MTEKTSKLACAILAGGLGTRLASVVSDVPKPMASVAGRPFLEYLVAQARQGGCTNVVLCVQHLADIVQSHFQDGRRFSIPIQYSREQNLAGTAGALKLAAPLLNSDPILVLNGDSYCNANLPALLQTHRTTKAKATLVVSEVPDASRFGTVEVTPEQTITRFLEKTGDIRPGLVNAGIYALSKEVIQAIPPGRPCSIEREIFPSLVGNGLFAFRHNGTFIDIGTPESWNLAQTVLPRLIQ